MFGLCCRIHNWKRGETAPQVLFSSAQDFRCLVRVGLSWRGLCRSTMHHPDHFFWAEWFQQQIVSADVEHLRPQRVVRQPGSHNEHRRLGLASQDIPKLAPISCLLYTSDAADDLT